MANFEIYPGRRCKSFGNWLLGLRLFAFCFVLGFVHAPEGATTLEFASYWQGAPEDEFRIEVPISRDGNLAGVTTVRYFTTPGEILSLAGTAIPEIDYTEISGILEFAPGETQKVISVPIIY